MGKSLANLVGCLIILISVNKIHSSTDASASIPPKKIIRKIIKTSEQRPQNGVWKGAFAFQATTGLEDETLLGSATFHDVTANSFIIQGKVLKANNLKLNSLKLLGSGSFNGLESSTFLASGVITLDASNVTFLETKGFVTARNCQFENIIVHGNQVYLENTPATNIFVITNNAQVTPRVFIKGDQASVKTVYFLRPQDLPHIMKFLSGSLTEDQFFNSGIARTKGQVIKESNGKISIIQSLSNPNFFGLSNGITIQLNEDTENSNHVVLVRPNGDIVNLPD